MTLTMMDVCRLCADLNILHTPGPNGVLLDSKPSMRLESGSGVAGRGGYWSLVDVASGKRTRAEGTRSALRLVLMAWLAGPKPETKPGHVTHLRFLTRSRRAVWVTTRLPPQTVRTNKGRAIQAAESIAKTGLSHNDAAKQFGVTRQAVSAAAARLRKRALT